MQASGEQAAPAEGAKALIWERAWYKQHPGARRTGGETERKLGDEAEGNGKGALQAIRMTFAFFQSGMGAIGRF